VFEGLKIFRQSNPKIIDFSPKKKKAKFSKQYHIIIQKPQQDVRDSRFAKKSLKVEGKIIKIEKGISGPRSLTFDHFGPLP
jgi:hypothetical protein